MIRKLVLTLLLLHICIFFAFAQTKYKKELQRIEKSEQRGGIIDVLEFFDVGMECAGIEFNLPPDFCKMDPMKDFSKVGESMNSFLMYRHWIQSKDSDCILMVSTPFCYAKEDSIKSTWGKKNHSYRLYDNLNDPTQYRDIPETDYNQYNTNLQHRVRLIQDSAFDVKYYTNDKTTRMFNADTVIFYSVPTNAFKDKRFMNTKKREREFRKSYPFCKVLLIQKQDRGYVYITCFFSKNGIAKADKYLDSLTGLVWYKAQYTLRRSGSLDPHTDPFPKFMEEVAASGAKFKLPPNFERCVKDSIEIANKRMELRFQDFYDYYLHATIQSTNRQVLAIVHAPRQYNSTILKDNSLKASDFKYEAHDQAKEWFNADDFMIYQNNTLNFQRIYLSQESAGGYEKRYCPLSDYYSNMEIWLIRKRDKFIKIDLFFTSKVDGGISSDLLKEVVWYQDE